MAVLTKPNSELPNHAMTVITASEQTLSHTDFRYLAVLQFQDKNDRGVVHYHPLTDLPYMDQGELANLWGYGFVKINSIRQVENVGEYVTSRNLKKAVIVRGMEAKEIANSLKQKKKYPLCIIIVNTLDNLILQNLTSTR